MEAMFGGVLVGHIMNRSVASLPPGATADDLLQASHTTRQDAFPVVDADERVIGMASVVDLQGEDGYVQPDTRVAEFMRPAPRRITPDQAALRAIETLAGDGLHRGAVVDGEGRLIGSLAKDDLVRFLQQQQFRRMMPSFLRRPGGDPADPYRPPAPTA